VYVLSWEATGSSPPTGGSNPVFHVDLTDGGAVRTYTTGARLDHARVAPAVRQFAPQVPVTDLPKTSWAAGLVRNRPASGHLTSDPYGRVS